MKKFILKREIIIRFFSLLLVVASVFIDEIELKITLLILGISGLIGIYFAKGQKSTAIIFFILLILAVVIYYLISTGKLFLK